MRQAGMRTLMEEERQAHDSRAAPQTSNPILGLQRALVRTLLFIGFLLAEYIRSGRFLIEVVVSAGFYILFLRADNAGIDGEKFFSLTSLYMLALAIFTTSALVRLGDRPQGYLILVRHVGRAGYLLAIYSSALLLLTGSYLLISLATATLSQLAGLDALDWLFGTVPLLLNVGLMAALMLLLSPLVFSTGWRLLVLALIALAFSRSFVGNATLDQLPPIYSNVLSSLQTILSWPMVPALSGFSLAIHRDYSGSAAVILLAQFSLLVALLCLAIYAFSRRELILGSE